MCLGHYSPLGSRNLLTVIHHAPVSMIRATLSADAA